MLNFYLFGVVLVGCVVAYDILVNELVEDVIEENKHVPIKLIAFGITLGVAFSMLLSWVTLITRAHSYLMKKF